MVKPIAFAAFLLSVSLALVPHAEAQCTVLCSQGFTPWPQVLPAIAEGCGAGGRRLLVVQVAPSFLARVKNGVSGAQIITNVLNGYNSLGIPYFFVRSDAQCLEGSGEPPSVRINDSVGLCSNRNAGFACSTGIPNPNFATVNIFPRNWSLGSVRVEDIEGRLYHELTHVMGGNSVRNCTNPGALGGSCINGRRNISAEECRGSRPGPLSSYVVGSNFPNANDLQAIDMAFSNPGGCTGTEATMTEEVVGGGGAERPPDVPGPCALTGSCDPGGSGGWAGNGCVIWFDCDGDGTNYVVDCNDRDPGIGACYGVGRVCPGAGCSGDGGGGGGNAEIGGVGQAVRNCTNYSEMAAVFREDVISCLDHCAASNADACEWNVTSGDCYAEFGQGCSLEAGYDGWYGFVLADGGGPGPGGGSGNGLTKGWAVRGCSNYYDLGAVYKASAAECHSYCQGEGADACEWWEHNGDCYAEFGDGCYLEDGYGSWWGAVYSSEEAGVVGSMLERLRPMLQSLTRNPGDVARGLLAFAGLLMLFLVVAVRRLRQPQVAATA